MTAGHTVVRLERIIPAAPHQVYRAGERGRAGAGSRRAAEHAAQHHRLDHSHRTPGLAELDAAQGRRRRGRGRA